MRTILLNISYVGDDFSGFVKQPERMTVAGELEYALSKLMNEEVQIKGCSRTDSKVHALDYYATFSTNTDIPTENIILGGNTYLHNDISIKSAVEVSNEFEILKEVKKKEYKYLILNSKRPNPFYNNRAMFYPMELDTVLMDRAAKEFIGTHDFKAFSNTQDERKTTIRTVYDAGVEREGDLITFYISADGFLYNMVRIIVGTILEIGKKKFEISKIRDIMESKDRTMAGPTAVPYGLYLNKVELKDEKNKD